MHNGPAQEERDWHLGMKPFEGYPNPWADPVFQPYLFGYDADREVEVAWSRYWNPGGKGESEVTEGSSEEIGEQPFPYWWTEEDQAAARRMGTLQLKRNPWL